MTKFEGKKPKVLGILIRYIHSQKTNKERGHILRYWPLFIRHPRCLHCNLVKIERANSQSESENYVIVMIRNYRGYSERHLFNSHYTGTEVDITDVTAYFPLDNLGERRITQCLRNKGNHSWQNSESDKTLNAVCHFLIAFKCSTISTQVTTNVANWTICTLIIHQPFV